MGEIEEIDDDNEEFEKENTTATNDDNPKIDFTKPCPKEFLPLDANEASDVSINDNESDNEEGIDFFENETGSKSNSNLTSKRLLLFIMLFPMVVSGGYKIYDAIGIKMPPFFWQLITVVLVFVLVILAAKNFGLNVLKVVLVATFAAFLIPTYQVHNCSPIDLKNDMIGTWFSLKTDASAFLSKSFVNSKCIKKFYFGAPFYLSLVPLKIKLKADINDLISHKIESNGKKTYSLLSKRSVKKKFHKIHLLLKGDTKVFEMLEKALSLSGKERDRSLLLFSGSIVELDDKDNHIKNEIEENSLLVRPIIYNLDSVKFVDRYVKLKNPDYVY